MTLHGVTTLVALLLSVAQTTAMIFIGVDRIVALDGDHVVVRNGFQASFYDRDGSLLAFEPSVADVAVGEQAFWYIDRTSTTPLCRLSKVRDAQAECVALPVADEIGTLHYSNGSIYFFGVSKRHAPKLADAIPWDLYRLSEREHSKFTLEGEPVLSHWAPNWCDGPFLEYSFTHDEKSFFGGVVEAELPTNDPSNLRVLDCASNGTHVASGVHGRLFVDSSETKFASTGSIYAFQGGWLTDDVDSFSIYDLSGSNLVAEGKKPIELGLKFDGLRFYLVNFANRRSGT